MYYILYTIFPTARLKFLRSSVPEFHHWVPEKRSSWVSSLSSWEAQFLSFITQFISHIHFKCLNVRMGEKYDLLTLTVEWLLVPDRVVWVSQKLLISWEFAVNGAKHKKHPVSSRSAGENALWMRGQLSRARLVKADRKGTVMQITMHYNSGKQKSISEHKHMSNLKQIQNKVITECTLLWGTLFSDKYQFRQTNYLAADMHIAQIFSLYTLFFTATVVICVLIELAYL